MAQPGQPTPEQLQALFVAESKRRAAAEAQRRGITVEELEQQEREKFLALAKANNKTPQEYFAQLQRERMEAMRAQQQGQGPPQPGQPGQQQKPGQSPNPQQAPPQQQMQRVAVSPGQPVDPKALAVAKFLRSQALKPRTCILNGERKDMFKGTLPTAQNIIRTIRSDQVTYIPQSSELFAPSSPLPTPKPPQRRTPSFHP